MCHTTQPTLIALERRAKGRLQLLDRVLTVLGSGAYLAPKGTVKRFYTHAGNSSCDHTWQTPKALLTRLYAVFSVFDLDPCSPTASRRLAPVRAKLHYTLEDDGLSLPWFGNVFLNPPYGRKLSHWVKKAHQEIELGNANVVVALLPARTDTAYWHEHVTNADVFFLRGRLRFGDILQSAPFPSALAVWGASAQTLTALDQALPNAWRS